MKIIILGAGRVGESVAEQLVSEQNEITIIDHNADMLSRLQERFDLRGIVGNGVEPAILAEAGAADADVLLACTTVDALNLTACKVAHQSFNTPYRIARLRAAGWHAFRNLLDEDGFAVNQVICPEASITQYVQKLVEYPEALQVREFAQGLAALISVRVDYKAPMHGNPPSELEVLLPEARAHVAAVYRRFANEPDRFVPTSADTRILAGDEVFILVAMEDIRPVLRLFHQALPPVRSMMIAGGGNIGLQLARTLQDHIQLKIVDASLSRCEHLSTTLDSSVLVLQGDATDEDLLMDENVSEVDFFCALTNDDENNIMSGLLAKQLGVTRVRSLVNRRSYAELVHGTQIDIALSPAQAMMGELLAHIRQGDVHQVHSVRRGNAEAIEIAVHGNSRSSHVVGRTVGSLRMPPDTHIGLIVRGLPDPEGLHPEDLPDDGDSQSPATPVVLAARDDTEIQPGDHLIIFVPHRRTIRAVEKLFRARPTLL